MFKVGVFPGKFYPPHRGHLTAILKASTQCAKLYVVVCANAELESHFTIAGNIQPITLNDRVRWLSIELRNFSHIKVVGMEEKGVPIYPYGWKEWSILLNKTITEEFQAIFGSDSYKQKEGYTDHFPNVEYVLADEERERVKISATEIRANPYKYWDFILGAARPHFAKRILIAGTESCGKTTLTTLLAKYYNTAWTEEEGRYYSARHLGGNESTFVPEDFFNICADQRRVEDHALRSANRLVFFDTDAVITQYYCEMYTGCRNPKIDSFIDESRYDIVLYLVPDVEWVDDGLRFKGEQAERNRLNEKLYQMYCDYGFFPKMYTLSGTYEERLTAALKICDNALKKGGTYEFK